MEVTPRRPANPSSSQTGWPCGGRSPVRFHQMSPSGNDNFDVVEPPFRLVSVRQISKEGALPSVAPWMSGPFRTA